MYDLRPNLVFTFRFLVSVVFWSSARGRARRTATALTCLLSYVYGRRRVTSGLTPARRFCLTYLVPMKPNPVPARRVSKVLRDCKITPAYGACQERNTIGCILNNDGLGAGVADSFSTRQIHRGFTKVTERLEPGREGSEFAMSKSIFSV
jgi:hypothetical protein